MNLIQLNKYSKYLTYNKFYNTLSNNYIKNNTNGCGSGILAYIIPNSLFGIMFCVVCRIHDICYIFAKSKKISDINLRKNIKTISKIWYNNKVKELDIKWYQFYKYYIVTKYYTQRKIVNTVANIYYISVFVGGKKAWDNSHLKKYKY